MHKLSDSFDAAFSALQNDNAHSAYYILVNLRDRNNEKDSFFLIELSGKSMNELNHLLELKNFQKLFLKKMQSIYFKYTTSRRSSSETNRTLPAFD